MRFLSTTVSLLCFSPIVFAQPPQTLPGAKVELRLLSLSEEEFAKFTLEYPNFSEKGVPTQAPQFLNKNELEKLLLRLQSTSDAWKPISCKIIQAPTIAVANNSSATVTCGNSHKFVTHLEEKTVNGQSVSVPKEEAVFEGLTAAISATVAADRLRVWLKLDIKNTTIDPVIPLIPCTSFITPIFEGGSQGMPIPFTQFVQRPNISNLQIQSTVVLADKSSTAIYLGKQMVPSDRKEPRSVLASIPYLSRLFRNPDRESQHVVVIATASVTEVPIAEVLIKDYRKAVAEGRLDDAKSLAIKALETDPKCFANCFAK